MTLNPKSRMGQIYALLLSHEYMRTDTIEKRLSVRRGQLSPQFTKLRRLGLIKASGLSTDEGGRRWIKAPQDKPFYPPQPDFKRTKNSKQCQVKPEVSALQLCDHLISIFADLRKVLVCEQAASLKAQSDLDKLKRTFQRVLNTEI